MALGAPIPAPSSLDGNPPNPTSSTPQPPSLQQLSPSGAVGGSMQVVQMSLQAAAQAAKLIDLIGQVNPNFAPTAQMLIEQLKGGLRSSLQQGTAATGASMNSMLGGGPGAAAPGGPSQAPPPMLPSGM